MPKLDVEADHIDDDISKVDVRAFIKASRR